MLERVAAGEPLTRAELDDLAAAPDVLTTGMLADTHKRRLHGTRVTFLRVASWPIDGTGATVPAGAREVRLAGAPANLASALEVVAAAKRAAGPRTVVGLAWRDVEKYSEGGSAAATLEQLRLAGLDGLAELALDSVADPDGALAALTGAGFPLVRLTIDKAPPADRLPLLVRAGELQREFPVVHALHPLPLVLNAFRPTTGYEDVKMVALARLAAPNVPTIQVDWPRYGPKLAQVALTFGADDIDGVSGSDDAPEGRRRAPLEEIRRNIEAAGFEPVERDGHWA